MYAGQDFGFVGGSYEAPVTLQDAQRLINWYVEVDPMPTAKEQLALLGCPGLNPVASTITGQVRGMWVLPGSQQALVVVSNRVYLMTITVPATQTSIPQYAVAQVGTLLTNNGPVCIRDNGVLQNGFGGYAVIVDGQFGYYYLLSGTPQTVVFTANVSTGSNQLVFSGGLPTGLIVSPSAVLTDSGSAIPAGTVFTAVNTVSLTATMSQNATNTITGDTITLTIAPFGQITDPGFLGADRIAFIEGWLIFNDPQTRTFYTTGPVPYSILFPGSFFALKDSSTDNLITLFENNRELWLVGERTSEVWFNAGGANFAFQRIPGVGPQIGCAAVHSITRSGATLLWLGRNEQGQNIVVMTNQYTFTRISTHAVEHAIATYPVVSDAIGYGYEEDGHLFYMLTFPTADVTWCFDMTAGVWHQRASYTPTTGQFHRHRSNCFMDFGDVRLVGDYQTGQVHQMSRSLYSDAGAPLVCIRRTPHVWQKSSRERVFCSQLQIEFTPGVGLQTGQGSDPQMMLRWSDDGGFTWSTEHWSTIGKVGRTRNRAIFRLLGHARDRVWEASFSDPVQRDIIGATLFAEAA
jgi:hypothetical protein